MSTVQPDEHTHTLNILFLFDFNGLVFYFLNVSCSSSTSQSYASMRNRPVAVVERARCPARFSSTGLERPAPIRQFDFDVFVKRPLDVLELEWVSGHVVDFHKHLREERWGAQMTDQVGPSSRHRIL